MSTATGGPSSAAAPSIASFLAVRATLAEKYRRDMSSLRCLASAKAASNKEAKLTLTLKACKVSIFSSSVSDLNGPLPFTAAHTAITEAISAAGAAPARPARCPRRPDRRHLAAD